MTPVIAFVILPLYLYTLVTTISVLLLENRNPVKSLAWVLVLLFIPILGMWFYLLLGQDYRKNKIVSFRSVRRIKGRPKGVFDVKDLDRILKDHHLQNQIRLLYRNCEAVPYENNKVDVFADGKSTFEALFEEIEKAQSHIHLQFFIFEDDRVSNQLRELLIRKATEGVRVRMIYDYVGSFKLSRKYLRTLKKAGVYVSPFLPFRWQVTRANKINYRNHRKLVIIDGKVGFTGGLNVADRYRYGDKLGAWRDTFVRIEGAAVHGLQTLFIIDWYFVDQKMIGGKKYFPEPELFDNNIVQIVSSGPDTDWEAIMQGIAAAVMSATRYIYIHSPYFMPNEVVLESIQMAALSGVDVRLMIPMRSDSRFSDASTFSYLGEIMEAGVRVYRYKDGFIHSKAIVIDDFVSIIGSTNMDERSFAHNFEASAFIYSSDTAFTLRRLFEKDRAKCEELTMDAWANRRRRQKLKESFARLFSPLL